MKRIVISIANNFDQDRRMLRSAMALQDHGYEVEVLGKETGFYTNRQEIISARHIDCWFKGGFLFYLEFNIRLFIKLLFTKADILLGVDSDTLLANTLASLLKRKPLIIDMHELFTEVPELAGHSLKKSIWKGIEKIGIARSSKRYTVSHTIAEEYQNRYGRPFEIIRNVPELNNTFAHLEKPEQLNLAYIGALNMGRGLVELIRSLKQMDDVHLLIYGTGDIETELRILVDKLKLKDRIQFGGWINPSDIHGQLQKAHVGVNLLDPSSKSYYLSMANKYFDYIHAGLPIISMNFPEYQALNATHQTSLLVDDLREHNIISAIKKMHDKPEFYKALAANCQLAKQEWNWEIESKRLISIFDL